MSEIPTNPSPAPQQAPTEFVQFEFEGNVLTVPVPKTRPDDIPLKIDWRIRMFHPVQKQIAINKWIADTREVRIQQMAYDVKHNTKDRPTLKYVLKAAVKPVVTIAAVAGAAIGGVEIGMHLADHSTEDTTPLIESTDSTVE